MKNISKRKIPNTDAEAPRKRGRPRKPDALTPKQRAERLKEKDPTYFNRAKAKQLQRESVIRMHIIRNHISEYPIPEWIDQDSGVFARIRATYFEQVAEPTIEVTDEPEEEE